MSIMIYKIFICTISLSSCIRNAIIINSTEEEYVQKAKKPLVATKESDIHGDAWLCIEDWLFNLVIEEL